MMVVVVVVVHLQTTRSPECGWVLEPPPPQCLPQRAPVGVNGCGGISHYNCEGKSSWQSGSCLNNPYPKPEVNETLASFSELRNEVATSLSGAGSGVRIMQQQLACLSWVLGQALAPSLVLAVALGMAGWVSKVRWAPVTALSLRPPPGAR